MSTVRLLTLVLLGATAASARTPPAQDPLARPLESPLRIAVGDGGRLLVTDYRGRRVVTLDRGAHRVLAAFPVEGRPTAIGAFQGRIFVGNEARRCVEIYAGNGQRLGILGGRRGRIGDPCDLAVDPARGLLFVVDGSVAHVAVFDVRSLPGRRVGTIGDGSGGIPSLLHPTGITLDPVKGEVYVADFGDLAGVDPSIRIFRYDGSLADTIQSAAAAGSHFFRPQGLALGSTGHVFVVDAWFGRVVVMDRQSGLPVATLGEYGTAPGQLRLPLDLVVTGPNRDVFVTSNGTGRVECFAQGGKL